MNCQIIQRRLLGSEDPERPSAEVQAHLDACAPCREWQSLLLQMEDTVRRLPVPPAAGRAMFLKRVLETDAAAAKATPPPATRVERPRVRRPRPVISRVPGPAAPSVNLRLGWRFAAAGLAATLLLALIAWWSVREPEPVAAIPDQLRSDQLVLSLMHHDLELAREKDEGKRKDTLANMADELMSAKLAVTRAEADKGLVDFFDDCFKRVAELAGSNFKEAIERKATTATAKAVPASARRVAELHRNQGLIDALVKCGMQLATQAENLKRAASCGSLARFLADEIRDSVKKYEGARVREIGGHFRDLLRDGVAYNLNEAHAPAVSASRKEIEGLGNELVRGLAKPLEAELAQVPPDASFQQDLDAARRAIADGRAEIENVLSELAGSA